MRARALDAEGAHLLVEMAALEAEVARRVGGVAFVMFEGAQHEVALDGCEALLRVAELNPKNPPAFGERVSLEIDADDVVPLAG